MIKKLNIRLLGDRVLVLPDPNEKKTGSGIIIPDVAQEKPRFGKVISVGKGTKTSPIDVKVGDRILYEKYAGRDVALNQTQYIILTMSDICAVL